MLRTAKLRKRFLPDTRGWSFVADLDSQRSQKTNAKIDSQVGNHRVQMQKKWEDFLKEQDTILERLQEVERENDLLDGQEESEKNTDVQPTNPYRKFLTKLDHDALEHPDSVQQRLIHNEQEVHLVASASAFCKWLEENLRGPGEKEDWNRQDWHGSFFSKPHHLRELFAVGGDAFQLALERAGLSGPRQHTLGP